VQGYEMKEKDPLSQAVPQPVAYAALLGFTVLVAAGILLRSRQRKTRC
jgi:hypothetical protein